MTQQVRVNFREMLNLQLGFNNETNGECWLAGITKEDKVIDWYVCIFMEAAEALDSFPWKHWKGLKGKSDIENFILENVDIWHFLMSKVIEIFAAKTNNLLDTIEDSIEFLDPDRFTVRSGQELQKVMYHKNGVDAETALFKLAKKLLKASDDIEEILSIYYAILTVLEENYDFDQESLYRMYIGKNALNVVRQMNGYKEGTYIKEWDGQEDNVYMIELLRTIKPEEKVSFKGMIKTLDSHYKNNVAIK